MHTRAKSYRRDLSETLHEPEPRMAGRITFDAAIFDVLVAPVEVGRLEACRVEPDPDTTTSPRNFFHSCKQARTDTLMPVSLCNGQHIDRTPGPIGLSSRAALYFACQHRRIAEYERLGRDTQLLRRARSRLLFKTPDHRRRARVCSVNCYFSETFGNLLTSSALMLT